jgi:site-specific DNA-methyltransferase (adenine-specific)
VPRDVIFIPSEKGGLHPTQKPIALMEYMVRTYSNEGDTVLDNCMGSGTTGVACKRLGRNFIGIELDPGYFEIAKKRINETKKVK